MAFVVLCAWNKPKRELMKMITLNALDRLCCVRKMRTIASFNQHRMLYKENLYSETFVFRLCVRVYYVEGHAITKRLVTMVKNAEQCAELLTPK